MVIGTTDVGAVVLGVDVGSCTVGGVVGDGIGVVAVVVVDEGWGVRVGLDGRVGECCGDEKRSGVGERVVAGEPPGDEGWLEERAWDVGTSRGAG